VDDPRSVRQDRLMAEMTCPSCGAAGDSENETLFEVRGQVQGQPVRRCVTCDSGLVLKRKLMGGLRVGRIPAETWLRMKGTWDNSGGPGWARTEPEDEFAAAREALEPPADRLDDAILEADIEDHLKLLLLGCAAAGYYVVREIVSFGDEGGPGVQNVIARAGDPGRAEQVLLQATWVMAAKSLG
jgi:hypothetical protein